MILAVSKRVLRGDGDETADYKRPQRAALRLDQQREADAADVRAEEIDDLPAIEPRQQRLGQRADREGDYQPVVAAEQVITQLANDEKECDEKSNQIPRVDLRRSLPRADQRVGRRDARLRCFAHWLIAAVP